MFDLLTPSQQKNIKAATDGYGAGSRRGGAWRLRDELNQYLRAGTLHSYIAKAIKTAGGGMFWPELWEVLRVAEEEVDWAKPAFLEIADRERVFGSFQAFYSEMVEPWMGEWRRLSERYRRYAEAATPEAKQEARKETAAEIMARANPRHVGRPKNGEKSGGSPLSRKSSDNPERLAKRLKRDHPEIAAKVEAGGYASIREAAIEAGIIRKSTPLAQLRSAWKRASAQERDEFRRETAG